MKIKWKLETRKLKDLKANEHNPRVLTEKGMKDLTESVKRFGLAEPLVIQPDGFLLGGHARLKVLEQQGITEAQCMVPDRTLTEQEAKELNVRLNKNVAGEFDWDILANEFEIEELKDWGFSEAELFDKELIDPDFKPTESDTRLDELKPIKCPECGHEFTPTP